MLAAVSKVSNDVDHHWEPDAGHWWDGEAAPGADCVDWLPLFDLIKNRTLDPSELDFQFTSPGPWYSASFSYATILSAKGPTADCTLASKPGAKGVVELTTGNVRSLIIDGKALRGKGLTGIIVDGAPHELSDGPLTVGPLTGKRKMVQGPYNQVYQQPFLFVYPDDALDYMHYASYLVSDWALIGNGHAGALPRSALTSEVAKAYHLVHLGATRQDLTPASDLPFTWDDAGAQGPGKDMGETAVLSVFDDGQKLSALLHAPVGKAYLLYRVVPFSSRAGLPDYLFWNDAGLVTAGFFDADWQFDPKLGVGW